MNQRFLKYAVALILFSGSIIIKSEDYIIKPDSILHADNKYATFSSNLPIVIINTNNKTIPNEPKIQAQMTIIYNGEGIRNNISDKTYDYNGYIGIELRGNSTQNFEKKPYGVETRNEKGDNLNVEILGMPAENDWVFRASYIDRSFIRNPLAHHLSQQTGQWSSRFRHCELFINNEYLGIYIILEKIKRDKNRVNVANLDPDELDEENITGGYIYEITGFHNDFGMNRRIRYPKLETIHSQQLNYIKDFDNGFRQTMDSHNWNDPETGYSSWIDVKSFIDEIIVQETMRNSDAYGWSAYFHKDKNGPIKAGPVWDFDQAAGYSTYNEGYLTYGWVFEIDAYPNPTFWRKLFEDPLFKYHMKVRWFKLRSNEFSRKSINHFIDSIADLLDEAQARNFQKWNILGKQLWRDSEGWEYRIIYYDYIIQLKNYLDDRMNWIDMEMDNVPVPIENKEIIEISDLIETSIYPNPVNSILYLELKSLINTDINVILSDLSGKTLSQFDERIIAGEHIFALDMQNFRKGIYILKIYTGNNQSSEYKIYKKH